MKTEEEYWKCLQALYPKQKLNSWTNPQILECKHKLQELRQMIRKKWFFIVPKY